MKHYRDEWVQEWCDAHGWTELSRQSYGQYWAFPPHAVMPEPIPPRVLRSIKSQKGFCLEEKLWLGLASVATVGAIVFGYFLRTPMPLIFAFAFSALTVAGLEVD